MKVTKNVKIGKTMFCVIDMLVCFVLWNTNLLRTHKALDYVCFDIIL